MQERQYCICSEDFLRTRVIIRVARSSAFWFGRTKSLDLIIWRSLSCAMASTPSASPASRHFFCWCRLSIIYVSDHNQANEPPRYSLKLHWADRDTKIKASCFFHHLTQENYLLLEHMGPGLLVYLPFDYRQGRQGRHGGVLLRLEMVWSRKKHAWLWIPW